MEKNWLIIGHGSASNGYAVVEKFSDSEAEAKKALMRVIKKERKEAIAEFGCVFDWR